MNFKIIFIITLLKFQTISSSILLWSNKKLEIPPLEKFTDDDLSILLEKLDYPEVMAYNNPNRDLPFKFKELLNGCYSAYNNNNEDLTTINATDLSGDVEGDFRRIKSDLNLENRLFIIISASNSRKKRDVDDVEKIDTNKGPVVYIGKSISNEKYGIIYSSSALILKINKTDLNLGETSPDMITVDTVPRESITRLNVKFPQEKFTLRFIFQWIDYYWYLTSVRISETSFNTVYNLTIDKDVVAPTKFSYHCSGTTTFSDQINEVYLLLTDMQVQIDAKKQSFDNAYDCINFTTIPIWSGILVSSLLIVVLMLSLIALGDIKTMDKFDNHKTKQLTITVNE